MLPAQQALAVEELNKENLDYEITGGIVTSIMVMDSELPSNVADPDVKM